MDILAIREQIERERKIELAVNGATFHVKLPTEYAWRVAIEAHTGVDGRTQFAAVSRIVLDAALTGWTGVTGRYFGIDNDEPVAFSAEARVLLLECRPDLSDDLITEVSRLRRERSEKLQAAQKN